MTVELTETEVALIEQTLRVIQVPAHDPQAVPTCQLVGSILKKFEAAKPKPKKPK